MKPKQRQEDLLTSVSESISATLPTFFVVAIFSIVYGVAYQYKETLPPWMGPLWEHPRTVIVIALVAAIGVMIIIEKITNAFQATQTPNE